MHSTFQKIRIISIDVVFDSYFQGMENIDSNQPNRNRTHRLKRRQCLMMCKKYNLDVGVRPDNRGPFVSAKGPKTIDAQFSRIRLGGR